MPTVASLGLPRTQFFADDGTPNAGGKLYAYLAGTSTPASTYADSTGNVANEQDADGGLVLDLRGELPLWLDVSLEYRLALFDEQGYEIWSEDNVSIPGTTAAIAAGTTAGTTAGTAAAAPAVSIATAASNTANQALTAVGAITGAVSTANTTASAANATANAASSAATAANTSATNASSAIGSFTASLANGTDATKGAALVMLTPRDGNEQAISVGNYVIGKITPFRKFGGAQGDGTDQRAAVQRAANSGRYVEFVEGDMLMSGSVNINGGGFFGVGRATRFLRNFSSASPVIWNPTGSVVMLRDFAVGTQASLFGTLIEGDHGIQMGYPGSTWAGGGDVKNVYVTRQYRGWQSYNGPLAPLFGVVSETNQSDGFTFVDGSCSLYNCLTQFNGGHGISTQSTNPSANNLTVDQTTSFYNQGYGYYAAASSGTHNANSWLTGFTSSFDHAGGVYVNYHDHFKLSESFIEYAGGSVSGGPVNWNANVNANGIVLADGATDSQLANVSSLNNSSAGVTLHATSRTQISNLNCTDNGLAFPVGSAPQRSGLNIQNGNTDLNINGYTGKGAYGAGGSFAQLYALTISTADNTGLINGISIDRYLEEVPQPDVDLKIVGRGPAAVNVASASTIVLPLTDDLITITGSTTINTIASSVRSRLVTLMFPTSLTVHPQRRGTSI